MLIYFEQIYIAAKNQKQNRKKHTKSKRETTENLFNSQIYALGWFVALIILLCHCVHGIAAKNQLCEVETGQTNIILDIEESRGNCKCDTSLTRTHFFLFFTFSNCSCVLRPNVLIAMPNKSIHSYRSTNDTE